MYRYKAFAYGKKYSSSGIKWEVKKMESKRAVKIRSNKKSSSIGAGIYDRPDIFSETSKFHVEKFRESEFLLKNSPLK